MRSPDTLEVAWSHWYSSEINSIMILMLSSLRISNCAWISYFVNEVRCSKSGGCSYHT